MGVVELRSDTMTRPTPSMRQAMAAAEVGDDVFGEDPTVNRLEDAGGRTPGQRGGALRPERHDGEPRQPALPTAAAGEEMILGHLAHTFYYEQGGSAAVGSVHPRTLPNRPDGTLAPRNSRRPSAPTTSTSRARA